MMKKLRNNMIALLLTLFAFQFAPELHARVQSAGTSFFLPPEYQLLDGVSLNGSTLAMKDGSQWDINPVDAFEVMSWVTGDYTEVPLVVSANNSWLSGYKYYITNKNTNTYVEATFKVGPTVNGSYTNEIRQIDYILGELLLQDGSGYQTCWKVDLSDQYLLNRWQHLDAVVIGSNDNWYSFLFSKSSHILINVELNEYVRANEF